jgi:hypothetical protein
VVIGFGMVLAIAAVYQRETPAVPIPDTGELENELSLVQIEKMRVISPDSETAARLDRREEELKYALLADGTLRERVRRPKSVRLRRSADCPEPAASVPLYPSAVSGRRTPRS